VVCKTSPLADGSEIYIPFEALSAMNAEAKLQPRGDTALVTQRTSGQHAEVAVARPDGRPMLALSDIAHLLNARTIRTERTDESGQPIPGSKGDTVYLLAHLTGVSLQNGAVRVSASFPISYHVRMMTGVTPLRGYVDCVGADVPEDLNIAPVPPDSRGVSRLRAGQYSIDTARVVIETTRGAVLKEADGVCGPDSAFVVAWARRGVASNVKAPGTPLPLVVNRAGATTPTTPGGVEQRSADPDSRTSPSAGTGQPRVPRTFVRQAPPLPDDAEHTVQDPDNPNADAESRSDLPSRGGQDRTARGLQVSALDFQYDSDTQVEVRVRAGGRLNPYVHYLENGDLAVDMPSATLALADPDQADLKLPHPLLTGVTLVQAGDAPVTRLTLHTSRIVGFTVVPEGDGALLDLRLPRNADGALADKLIVVDAGHGGTSTGATGGGYQEKNVTLAIALKLRGYLEACGAKVVMTRDRDINVALDDRPHLANAINADLFISVHNDSNGVPNSASGTSTYYHNHDPSCRAMAQCVQQAILAVSGLPSRGVLSDTVMYQSGFAVLRISKMPAVLVEVGYINNHRDRTHLVDPDFQDRVAKAMCDGLRAYVEGRPQTASLLPNSSGRLASNETHGAGSSSYNR
jgi:N-acetylmuramoyl-L-alanine amidase